MLHKTVNASITEDVWVKIYYFRGLNSRFTHSPPEYINQSHLNYGIMEMDKFNLKSWELNRIIMSKSCKGL